MEREDKKQPLKSSRRAEDYKPKEAATPKKEHSNPVVRAIMNTGYTVWLIVLGVGIVLGFVVSVALL